MKLMIGMAIALASGETKEICENHHKVIGIKAIVTTACTRQAAPKDSFNFAIKSKSTSATSPALSEGIAYKIAATAPKESQNPGV